MGLGTIVVGGGAALGSGAFSQVQADRTINVTSAGDESAYIGLSAAPGAEDFVTNDGGEIAIDIGALDDADGINQSALTTFDELVQITNNTTNEIYEITVETGNEHISVVGDDDFPTEANTLSNTESVIFGLEFDLRDDGVTDAALDGSTLTITVSANPS